MLTLISIVIWLVLVQTDTIGLANHTVNPHMPTISISMTPVSYPHTASYVVVLCPSASQYLYLRGPSTVALSSPLLYNQLTDQNSGLIP